nr:hypothetical protein Iba_chr13bCG10510 [Ipomoea batatas]
MVQALRAVVQEQPAGSSSAKMASTLKVLAFMVAKPEMMLNRFNQLSICCQVEQGKMCQSSGLVVEVLQFRQGKMCQNSDLVVEVLHFRPSVHFLRRFCMCD